MRKSFLLIASLILATGAVSTANAQTEWGLGFLSYEIPVGVFVAVNDQTTIHAAIDYQSYDVPSGSTELKSEFAFAAAVIWDFWMGSDWGFGVAPGVTYRNFSPETGDSSSQTTVPILLAGHWDVIDNLTLWFNHGLVFTINSPSVGDSTTDWGTTGTNLTMFGFTVWAP